MFNLKLFIIDQFDIAGFVKSRFTRETVVACEGNVLPCDSVQIGCSQRLANWEQNVSLAGTNYLPCESAHVVFPLLVEFSLRLPATFYCHP